MLFWMFRLIGALSAWGGGGGLVERSVNWFTDVA